MKSERVLNKYWVIKKGVVKGVGGGSCDRSFRLLCYRFRKTRASDILSSLPGEIGIEVERELLS